MAFYADGGDVWKCPKHPSKRRRNGICPICLRDRLITLCPDCANVRPCACCTTATTSSSSSSSSSSFSLLSSGSGGDASRTAGRVPNLVASKPSFRRSRSVAIPFLRSRFGGEGVSGGSKPPAPNNRSKSSFWSAFRTHKSKKLEDNDVESENDYAQRLVRSTSVSVVEAFDSGAGDGGSSSVKSRGWYFQFRSPMKVFRKSKPSKVVHDRSPLHRG